MVHTLHCQAQAAFHARPRSPPGPHHHPNAPPPTHPPSHSQIPLDPEVIEAQRVAAQAEGQLLLSPQTFSIDKQAELVVLPERTRVALPCPDLPERVLQSVEAVLVGGAGDATSQSQQCISLYMQRAFSLHVGAHTKATAG